MRPVFPLFNSHLDLAHSFWKRLLQPKDTAIDATFGNGHDTRFIQSCIPEGKIYAMDIQESAIKNGKENFSNIYFFTQSHATFPKDIEKETVSLIVYNLGYLPGGDKSLTTTQESTLKSLQEALLLLKHGGLISITCYPGHPEGAEEEKALLEWSRSLDKHTWGVSYTQWNNRLNAPSLLLIQRCHKF